MKLYSSNDNYKLYQGNMLDMLEVIEINSIDSIITDPPYEINFMSKGWDNAGVSFQPDTWKKCYEVLKDGGYLLAFGGSRTFHRIACAIEDAGFEIRDTIMWLYGSGFPKSMDISKQIDKRADNNSEVIKAKEELGKWLKEKREYKKISKIELGKKLFNFDSNREDVPIQSWEIGKEIPTKEIYIKLKMILALDDRYDYLIEGRPSNYIEAEREVIGKKEKLESYQYKNNNVYQTDGDKEKITLNITIPSTNLAKQLQGWGTALKPSFEPIIVARKPFKGSLVDNVINNGVGGINIDECRVELNGDKKITGGCKTRADNISHLKFRAGQVNKEDNSVGRFPANTILTYDETDFDEVCGGFPNTKSTPRTPTIGGTGGIGQVTNFQRGSETSYFNDSGSASRYFYCAKASKKDRDEGLDEFEQEKVNDGRNTPIDNAFQRGETLRKNTHPTVKPTELMQYLVRLVSPNGATILDPFNGSGSTGKAVMYENKERNKNYKYIGIEITEEYLPIAKARIEYVLDKLTELKENNK